MHRIEVAGGVEARIHLDAIYLRGPLFAAVKKALQAGRDELQTRLAAYREQFADTDDARQLAVLQSRRSEFQAEANTIKQKLVAAEKELADSFRQGKDPSGAEEKAQKLRGRVNTLLSWFDKTGREIAALQCRLDEAFAEGWRSQLRAYSNECQLALATFDQEVTQFLAERAAGLARAQAGYEKLYENESRPLPRAVA
jgi:hypothetical protein